MGATFTYAAVYQVEAECRTPLRTGGADGDLEQVLRGRDGTAFLQGSSLSGALRNWLESGSDRALSGPLFGNQMQSGHLIISDAVFEQNADQYIRPRLCIDPATAAGKDGRKFDVAHIAKGSRLHFTLTWLGTAGETDELAVVERLLAALDAGAICLGAHKTNGFGQVSLAVKRRLFDLMDPADRQAWLEDRWDGDPLPLPRLEQTRETVFILTGQADNILVKTAPVLEEKDGRNSTYTPNLSEGGQAVLPGSSVKGAVQARAKYIAKVLGLDAGRMERWFGRDAAADDNGRPGQVRFEDGALSGPKKKVSRIRVDRFTGGVQRGGLFTEEPVSTELTLRITAPDEPALCGLLLYALRDLGLNLYGLGSGWAIGRGRISVKELRADAPDGRRAALRFDARREIIREDPSGLFRAWLEGLEATRHEA